MITRENFSEEHIRKLQKLSCSQKYFFSELKPSDLPVAAGVYVIFDKDTGETLAVYRRTSPQSVKQISSCQLIVQGHGEMM